MAFDGVVPPILSVKTKKTGPFGPVNLYVRAEDEIRIRDLLLGKETIANGGFDPDPARSRYLGVGRGASRQSRAILAVICLPDNRLPGGQPPFLRVAESFVLHRNVDEHHFLRENGAKLELSAKGGDMPLQRRHIEIAAVFEP